VSKEAERNGKKTERGGIEEGLEKVEEGGGGMKRGRKRERASEGRREKRGSKGEKWAKGGEKMKIKETGWLRQ